MLHVPEVWAVLWAPNVYVMFEAFTCQPNTSLRKEQSKSVFHFASPGHQQLQLLLCKTTTKQWLRLLRLDLCLEYLFPERKKRSWPTDLMASDPHGVYLMSSAAKCDQFIIVYIEGLLELTPYRALQP